MGDQGDLAYLREQPPGDCTQCSQTNVPIHILSFQIALRADAVKWLHIEVPICYQCMIDLGVWEPPTPEQSAQA